MHGMQALLAAALLSAALPGGLAAKSMISPKVSTYAFNKPGGSGFAEGVAGIMWQSTPSPLTPANFTIMFPFGNDIDADEAAADNGPGLDSRIEIHLPGFGGAYNSFGATHPKSTGTTTAIAGAHLPIQNGVRPYSRLNKCSAAAAVPTPWDTCDESDEEDIEGCIQAA